MSEQKPPTQSVGVGGIDAHGAMGERTDDRLLAMLTDPVAALRTYADKDVGFRAFVCTLTDTRGPATGAKTIEAVFRHIGATCWSDLFTKRECGSALVALFNSYWSMAART